MNQTSAATRVGPVYFQPLDDELAPVARYLRGHLLNAGCGTRDVAAFFRASGVTRVTRYDIASDDPDVILGPLEATPFESATFDAVLCNAVLEHVTSAEDSIRELARVVKPGGYVVVAVPFLQPFHAAPTDYRRYTADGLADLGSRAGLEVVSVLPVHTIAQTIGWILWAWAEEKGGRLRRRAVWLLVSLATRRWHRTDASGVASANTFQAVFQRPPEGQALTDAWRRRPVSPACARVPTMLLPDELRLLHYLADSYFTGADGACIVDAGCFLGGSTVALAEGLRMSLRRRGLPERPLIHSFDRFEVEEWTVPTFFPAGTPPGASFRAAFDANVAPYAPLVVVHDGDVIDAEWHDGPIEILFVDVAKHWTVCDRVTWTFFPHLIPGRSLVVQQDYLYHHWVAWLHVTMEFYADYFEYVCDTRRNSVVFRHTRAIPPDVLREHTVESLTTEEKIALMDRAAARFAGEQRDMLVSAKRHFLGQLAEAS
ncbi:MAG: class I SAM-dependent methyltransferase [Gemmatirosa sp.]|nr:class I SAM-dependent methyltransferase [Gemmatirosa sp.]